MCGEVLDARRCPICGSKWNMYRREQEYVTCLECTHKYKQFIVEPLNQPSYTPEYKAAIQAREGREHAIVSEAHRRDLIDLKSLVVCIHLERDPFPANTIRTIRRDMRPGGAIYIEVPAFAKDNKEPNIFTKLSLQWMLEYCGLRFVALGSCDHVDAYYALVVAPKED